MQEAQEAPSATSEGDGGEPKQSSVWACAGWPRAVSQHTPSVRTAVLRAPRVKRSARATTCYVKRPCADGRSRADSISDYVSGRGSLDRRACCGVFRWRTTYRVSSWTQSLPVTTSLQCRLMAVAGKQAESLVRKAQRAPLQG